LPFMTVLRSVAGPLASVLFAIGAMITVLSVANANIMTAPRAILALARDGLLPRRLAAVNAGGSPHMALLMTAAGSMLLAATGQFILVFGLIGTLTTLADLITMTSFFVLRAREPELARPYRARGYPLLPALAFATEALLLVLFNWADEEGFVAAIVLSAACVPFAWIARRNALDNPAPDGTR
jgi:amino acid transporter